MSLEKALAEVQTAVPECVAIGYVDAASGMLLGLRTVDSHPREVIDLLAAATGDLFNGPNVSMIERLFKKARGLSDDGHHYFQELIVNSDNLVHVFIRGKKVSDYIAVFVCRRTANLGMVLTKARLSMPQIEAAM